MHSTDASVRQHAKVYSNARKALVRLGADNTLLSKYKVLFRKDLKVSTAVVDIRLPSWSEATLAWFWNIDVRGDTTSESWMAERECIRLSYLLNADSSLVQYIEYTGSELRQSLTERENRQFCFRMKWTGLSHTSRGNHKIGPLGETEQRPMTWGSCAMLLNKLQCGMHLKARLPYTSLELDYINNRSLRLLVAAQIT